MNPYDQDAADWLDDMLSDSAEPSPIDDGFSARVMQRIDAAGRDAAAAEPAPCIAPAAAWRRLHAVQRREQRRQFGTTAGVIAAAAIGMITLWAQPGPTTGAALMLTAIGVLWLLLRDPQF